MKFTFSGHESFQCRHLWLKKGFDYLYSGGKFSDPSSVIKLGVGKNMVASIRYWMKAFDLIDENDNLNELSVKLLSDDGWDPFLEDEGTIWLLHYHLVKKGLASTYTLLFNELRKEKIEFSKEHFLGFIKRKVELLGAPQVSEKTLIDDFNVMTKMYIRTVEQTKDKEDSLSGLLTELDLLKSFKKAGEESYYIIENNERPEIPTDIFMYAITDFSQKDISVNFSALETNINSPGNIFAINRRGLLNKIETLCHNNRSIVYNDHAGIKELQFKRKEPLFTILDKYYAK